MCGRGAEQHLDIWYFRGGGQKILCTSGRQGLTFGVVGHLFEQGIAQTMDDPANDLTFHDHRVDERAAILHSQIACDVDSASAGIYLHFTGVRGSGVGLLVAVKMSGALQTRVGLDRQAVARHTFELHGQSSQADGCVSCAATHDAVRNVQGFLRDFQHGRCCQQHFMA